MIYELRLYSVTPGRIGDVHARFNTHLPSLFARHGVRCVGAWTALAGPAAPRFVYLMAYRDYAEREATWQAFYQDEDWWRIRAETNAGHEMVERHDLLFLKPNPIWQADGGGAAGGVHELVLQQVAPGQGARANEFLGEQYLPAVRAAGGRVVGVMDIASGPGMPGLAMLRSWDDAASWHRGRLEIEANAAINAEFMAQRAKLGNPIFGRAEVNLLQPAPGITIDATLGRQ